jgi:hypothetical protein
MRLSKRFLCGVVRKPGSEENWGGCEGCCCGSVESVCCGSVVSVCCETICEVGCEIEGAAEGVDDTAAGAEELEDVFKVAILFRIKRNGKGKSEKEKTSEKKRKRVEFQMIP